MFVGFVFVSTARAERRVVIVPDGPPAEAVLPSANKVAATIEELLSY